MAFASTSVILLYIMLLFVFSALLMWLWNITITRIFNIREITFGEAFRLMLITSILFGRGSAIGSDFNMKF